MWYVLSSVTGNAVSTINITNTGNAYGKYSETDQLNYSCASGMSKTKELKTGATQRNRNYTTSQITIGYNII